MKRAKVKFRTGQLALRHFKALGRKDYVRLAGLTATALWECEDAMGNSMGYATNRELRPLTKREQVREP